MESATVLPSRYVLGMRVDATTYEEATRRILGWGRAHEHRLVCLACVNTVMECYNDPSFQRTINACDIVTSDGQAIAWSLRLLGIPWAMRIYGPDLTLRVCEAAAKTGASIALYGGTEDSLDDFIAFLDRRAPGIKIVCRIAPPFRPPTPEEDEEWTRQIVESDAQIVFVGIGCPKQEKWMAAHKDRIPAPLLGVGAAFDFHSGRLKQAPRWMMRYGLEWLFRFAVEPRRLWRRYIYHNPRFLALFASQLLGKRSG